MHPARFTPILMNSLLKLQFQGSWKLDIGHCCISTCYNYLSSPHLHSDLTWFATYFLIYRLLFSTLYLLVELHKSFSWSKCQRDTPSALSVNMKLDLPFGMDKFSGVDEFKMMTCWLSGQWSLLVLPANCKCQ